MARMAKAYATGPMAKRLKKALDVLAWLGVVAVVVFKVFLHSTWGTAFLTASLCVVVAGALWGLVAAFRGGKGKSKAAPVQTMHHPDLGLTQLLTDGSWESNQVVEVGKPPVTFSSLAGNRTPTEEDVAAIHRIKADWPTLQKEAFEALESRCKEYGIPLTLEGIRLESVVLTNSKEGEFTLSFDAPDRQEKLPWGLYADFEDYKVCEADTLH